MNNSLIKKMIKNTVLLFAWIGIFGTVVLLLLFLLYILFPDDLDNNYSIEENVSNISIIITR